MGSRADNNAAAAACILVGALAILLGVGWLILTTGTGLRVVGAAATFPAGLLFFVGGIKNWQSKSQAVAERQSLLRQASSLNALLALSPTGFEIAVGETLIALGYQNVERYGGPGDLGSDLGARDKNGNYFVVQCKRFAPGNLVGSPDMQRFIGAMRIRGASSGKFITTSGFTSHALALALDHNVELIDGPTLVSLVGRANSRFHT
jgi:restriction endonuclease Mrr